MSSFVLISLVVRPLQAQETYQRTSTRRQNIQRHTLSRDEDNTLGGSLQKKNTKTLSQASMVQETGVSEPVHGSSAKGVESGNMPCSDPTTVNSSPEAASEEKSETEPAHVAQPKRDWRFWALLVSISLAGLLTALEGTITSTALPSIVNDLGGGHLYVWVVNGYLFAT
jgi:hypothetical protein